MSMLPDARFHLANLPTPIDAMDRMGRELGGFRLWVKRDDQTGLAFGGNKTRKLEYLLAEALAQGADTLITTGAVQSNHCRQTAAAAAKAGLGCILVLRGDPPPQASGNVLLDQLLGAQIVFTHEHDPADVYEQAFQAAEDSGHRVYRIPYGGSSPAGIAGYVQAMHELMDQGGDFDLTVLASSSGGTQAGIILGALETGFRGRILGISVDRPAGELRSTVAQLANQTADYLGMTVSVDPDEVEVNDNYLGGGYAVVGDLERDAIRRFARMEGLLLDPVYTGRAAGGLLDLIQRGAIDSTARILFWHTGGTPGLFAFRGLLD